MKSVILYALAPNPPRLVDVSGYWWVHTPERNGHVPVRAEIVGYEVDDALSHATPLPDEIVLGAVPFPQ